MTVPSGGDPLGYALDGIDGVLFGASAGGISGMHNLTQSAVQAAKLSAITANEVLNILLGLIFEGLRDGISLALSIIEAIITRLFGWIPGYDTVTALLADIPEIPILGDIVQAITGIVGGTLADITAFIHKLPTFAQIIAGLGGSGDTLTDLNNALANVELAVGDVNTLITDIGGTVIGDVSTAINGVVADIQALIAGLSGLTMADVITAINGGITNAQDGLNKWSTLLSSTGQASVSSLATFISNAATNAATVVSDLATFVSNTGESTLANVGLIISQLITLLSDIGTFLTNTGASSLSNLGTLISQLIAFLTAIPGNLVTGITSIEQNITDAIFQAINGGATVNNAVSTIKTGLSAIPGGNLTGGLNTALTISGNPLSALFNSSGILASQLTGGINTAVTFGGTALSTLFTNLNSTGQFAASGLTGALNTAVTFGGTALSTLLQYLNSSGQFNAAQITGAINTAVTYSGTALSSLLQYLNSSGQFNASQITGALNTATTISGNAVSTLFNGSGILASALTGAVNTGVTISGNAVSTLFNSSGIIASQLTGALNGAVTFGGTALSTLLQYLNPSGQFNAAQITGALNTATTISGNALSTLFNGSGLIASQITGALNTAVTVSGNPIGTLLTNLNSSGQFAASGLTGALNTAVTVGGTALSSLSTDWNGAVANANSLVASLGSVFPKTLPFTFGVSTNTALSPPVPLSQFQQLLDGIAGQANATVVNAVGALQANTAAVQSNVSQAIVNGANQVNATETAIAQAVSGVSSNAVTAISNVQGTVNGIYNAVNNTVTSIDQAVASVETGFASFFTGLFNSWTGGAAPSASAHDVAVTAAVASKTIADTHTVSIETISAQLPSFYGGGGAGGLTKSVSMAGTLPAGFSSASTIAVASASYNTVATTDTQTVIGAWSVTDTHAQYLFLRANAGFTSYVYAKVQANTPFTGVGNCEIGCVVAGVRHVFSTFALPGNFIAGSSYTFAAVGTTFTLSGPGGLNTPYTDGGAVSQVGSSYRAAGFGTDGYSREIDSWSAGGTTSYLIPSWMQATDTFDFAEAGGAGGGGGGGNPAAASGYSYGGVCGAWNTGTFAKSTFTGGGITVTVGGGGTGGAVGANGGAGASSAITASGFGGLTAAGGAGGAVGSSTNAADANGVALANTTFNNAGYAGGATSSLGTAGNSPGGGGGGGYKVLGSAYPGAAGAPGAVWITANDRSCPGSLGFWAFYDAAVTGPTTAYVATGETTTSGSFTDLATTTDQVTVTIGSSGMVIVMISAQSFTGTVNARALTGFAMSGANTRAAVTQNAIGIAQASGTSSNSVSGTFLLTGLTAGATTFKAKYLAEGGATGTWSLRTISVIPL